MTRARYLAVHVAPAAALVNVAINFAVGRALYPAGRAVPLLGDRSAGGDTLVGAFLIGLFTLLAVAPAARREARSGRVPGLGRRGWWIELARRRPLASALGFALASTLALGAPVVLALAATGAKSLPRDTFLFIKTGFAGVAGVATAVAAALTGLGPEPDVSDDPRWCRDPSRPTGGAVYPCEYVDKGGIAVTSRAHGCSGTPTWQLVVRGALDPAHVRLALTWLVARYPSLTTKIQSLDAVPREAKRFRYAHDPSFTLDAIFQLVDARGGDLDAIVREAQNRHLDLFADFPVTLTMAITSADACRLLFRQHHAIADGRAFIGLLSDFAAFLEAARAGRRPAEESLAPVGRRGELEALDLGPLRRLAYTIAGYGSLTRAIVRALASPVTPFAQNCGNDYTGDNGTVHWIADDSILDSWNAIRKRLGVSLNSLLTGALFAANARRHRALGLPLGRAAGTLQMETRPRDRPFLSFANHLCTLEVEARLDRVTATDELARSAQAQVDRQRARRTPWKRLLCERHLTARMTIAEMQGFVFDSKRAAHNLNFSNLIPLAFPPLGGAGWSVEEVLITTPVTPRAGISLTVIRYNGRLFFNFNYKSSAASRAETEELRRAFESVLREL